MFENVCHFVQVWKGQISSLHQCGRILYSPSSKQNYKTFPRQLGMQQGTGVHTVPHVWQQHCDLSMKQRYRSIYVTALEGRMILEWLAVGICEHTPCCAEVIFGKHDIITFSIISQHWDGTGSWNTSSWKTRTCLSCVIKTMAADDPATQGARLSAAMVLT